MISGTGMQWRSESDQKDREEAEDSGGERNKTIERIGKVRLGRKGGRKIVKRHRMLRMKKS